MDDGLMMEKRIPDGGDVRNLKIRHDFFWRQPDIQLLEHVKQLPPKFLKDLL